MTWLFTIPTKIKMYAFIGVGLLFALAIAVLKIRSSGAQSERIKALEKSLENKRIEFDVAANNAALDAATRRNKLRERWSRR